MLLTIKKIIEEHLLDDYMPDATTLRYKQKVIQGWIRNGLLQVAQGGYKKKKLITSEAIELFKKQFTIK